MYPWMQKAQAGLLGEPDNYGGLLADQELQRARQQGLLSFGASLLQASGPTAQPTGLGAALGTAMLQGNQAQNSSAQGSLQNQLMLAQLKKKAQTIVPEGATVIGDDGSTIFANPKAKPTEPKNEMGKLNADHQAGLVSDEDYATLKQQMLTGPAEKSLVGQVSPGEFTGASLEKYRKSGNYADLVRQYAPSSGQAAAGALNGDALDTAAEKYRVTGQLPPGMSRSVATTTKIMTRAAELASANGDDAHATVLSQQANKAAQGALAKLEQQKNMVGAFEKTASKNADLALQLSDKVDRSGVPLFNRYIVGGKKAIAGDVDTSRFQAANDTFVNEYAKVMSGSMGNTAVSDSARAHAHEMLNTAQTKEQYQGVVALLKQEMGNRMDSFEQQKAELTPAIGGTHDAPPKVTPKVSPPTNAKGWVLHQDAKGNKAYVSPDGKQFENAP